MELQRRAVLWTVGSFSRLVTSFLNTSAAENLETLVHLVHSRPALTPLLTVSNHVTTIDDPLMWGIKGFKCDSKKARWTLAAEDICFTNPVFSYFFRLGKCIPITRGAGINQPYMYEALDRLNEGEWLHTFPEGKICQDDVPIGRLKWGVASLIAKARVPPIVLPICHSGFEKVMPEKYLFGRRPLLPLCCKKVSIVVGEPMTFDIPKLHCIAQETVKRNYDGENHGSLAKSSGNKPPPGLKVEEDRVWQWLYAHVADQIRIAMQDVLCRAKILRKKMESAS